jgi:hypothetical protein
MRRYRQAGQSLIEVTFGLAIMSSIVIVMLDLMAVLYGISINDSACSNAVRAAADGNTKEAKVRAQAMIDQANSSGLVSKFSHVTLIPPVNVNITSQPIIRPDPETGEMMNPGGAVTGTVTVSTEVEIKTFVSGLFTKGHMQFKSTRSYPIRYIMPPSAIPNSPHS